MEKKIKILALLEIAIVLCSVFLVALPTITAEQTTQKVSASEVTTSSEDDYVLDIYGNANEDDTIDMRDLTYVKLIFFGKKPETELADAKYDGKINPLDFIQIKLIIVGKEKELTFVDDLGEAVTVSKPVKRIVVLSHDTAEILRALDAKDKIVGISPSIQDEVFFPELSKLPNIGGWYTPDYEAILTVNPDAVMLYANFGATEFKEKLPGVTIIALKFMHPPTGNKEDTDLAQSTRTLGYILDKEDEAEEFCDWYEGYFNIIKSRTDGLSEEEKPRVYAEWLRDYYTFNSGQVHKMCIISGGRNIAADLPDSGEVDPEWVIEQNPDVIVKNPYYVYIPCGYGVDDPTAIKELREEIMSRPGWGHLAAVKDGRVYMIEASRMQTGPANVIGAVYQAKWFHPELFKDLDPEAIHHEFLARFQGVEYDLDEHGVFVYPPIEIDGGLAGIPDRYKGQI